MKMEVFRNEKENFNDADSGINGTDHSWIRFRPKRHAYSGSAADPAEGQGPNEH
jgi:hypothetical protein